MIPTERLDKLLLQAVQSPGGITVLTGAGISAESNIPTFRGPEGYWTVGSKVYQPHEMATLHMFRIDPKAVWQWYLYRMGVCLRALPNAGHVALVSLERSFKPRFTLITQNVDNLHLRAGQSPDQTLQIHGNIFYVRCSAECQPKVFPLPAGVHGKAKEEPLSDAEWRLLHCQGCGSLLRPHVLWFDEAYNEEYYRLNSALNVAYHTALLLVVGTSGATNLPNQVVAGVHQNSGVIIDINPSANPFSRLATGYAHGYALRDVSSATLPMLVSRLADLAKR